VKRDIFESLQLWKASNRRAPLLLKGARQTGKTYALRQFGQEQYERCFYFNFEEKPEIPDFLSAGSNPRRFSATCRELLPGRLHGKDEVTDRSLAVHDVEPGDPSRRELVDQVLPRFEYGRVD
jgi:hypothetical protein